MEPSRCVRTDQEDSPSGRIFQAQRARGCRIPPTRARAPRLGGAARSSPRGVADGGGGRTSGSASLGRRANTLDVAAGRMPACKASVASACSGAHSGIRDRNRCQSSKSRGGPSQRGGSVCWVGMQDEQGGVEKPLKPSNNASRLRGQPPLFPWVRRLWAPSRPHSPSPTSTQLEPWEFCAAGRGGSRGQAPLRGGRRMETRLAAWRRFL